MRLIAEPRLIGEEARRKAAQQGLPVNMSRQAGQRTVSPDYKDSNV
jgi:hypothetical protein